MRVYVQRLVDYGSHGDGPHALTIGCGAFPAEPMSIDPPADPAYWFCVIDARNSDPAGESPWHYALHVRVRKADNAVDVATAACPGA